MFFKTVDESPVVYELISKNYGSSDNIYVLSDTKLVKFF